jgi:hypothetical protein
MGPSQPCPPHRSQDMNASLGIAIAILVLVLLIFLKVFGIV